MKDICPAIRERAGPVGGDEDCIAVDWGTSNRRAFLVGADGTVRDAVRDDRGALSVAPGDWPAQVDHLRERLGARDLGARDVVIAGMAGSSRGWREMPYVPVPAGLDEIAAGAVAVAPGVRLLPGVAVAGARHDVMRGEETLVLGAVALGDVPPDALVCQPGTHNKWVALAGGRLVDFATSMTGELFGLLKAGGTLAGLLDGPVEDGADFRDGLARGGARGDLSTALFEARAQVLLGARAPAGAASFASGVLIGADVAARDDVGGREVHVVGAGPLARLYAAAIARAGGRPVPVDAESAFVAGIHSIRRRLP